MARKAKPKRTKRTPKKRSAPDWAPKFLARLRDCGNIRAACTAAGIGKTAVYQRRDADEAFAAALAEALDDATDDLELEARRRAHDGVNEPVIYKGELCGSWVKDGKVVEQGTAGAHLVPLTIKQYSDKLLVFLLTAHRPERYRPNHKVELSGSVVTVTAEDLPDAELAAIIAKATDRRGGSRGGDPPPAGGAARPA